MIRLTITVTDTEKTEQNRKMALTKKMSTV